MYILRKSSLTLRRYPIIGNTNSYETGNLSVLERLHIAAEFSRTNLFDSLLALCSWTTLSVSNNAHRSDREAKSKAIEMARLFLDSSALIIILQNLILQSNQWSANKKTSESSGGSDRDNTVNAIFMNLLQQVFAALETSIPVNEINNFLHGGVQVIYDYIDETLNQFDTFRSNYSIAYIEAASHTLANHFSKFLRDFFYISLALYSINREYVDVSSGLVGEASNKRVEEIKKKRQEQIQNVDKFITDCERQLIATINTNTSSPSSPPSTNNNNNNTAVNNSKSDQTEKIKSLFALRELYQEKFLLQSGSEVCLI